MYRNYPSGYILLLGLVMLMLVFALENWTNMDIAIQSLFYNESGQWVITKAFHSQWKWLFYTGPKAIIIIIASLTSLIAIASFVPRWSSFLYAWRAPCLLVVASISFSPLLIYIAKLATGVD